jgi:hypothetical protein
MSSWNYRLCTYVENETRLYGVFEVYYDNDKKPNGWSPNKRLLQDWEEIEDVGKLTLL